MRGRNPGLAALLALGGCSLTPPYTPPPIAVPAAYKEAGPWAAAVPADHLPRGSWWMMFGDPVLDALEDQASAASPTLAAALARRDRAAAFTAQVRAEAFPQVDIGVEASRNRLSPGRPLAGSGATFNSFVAGGSLGYEIDLWSRIRSRVSAQQAEGAATAADLASARLAVQADLANAYFRLRGLDEQAAVLRENVAAFARAFELTDARHSGGAASGLDVGRARTQLSRARAQLALIVGDRALAEHAIAALTGAVASGFSIAAVPGLPAPVAVPAGVPSNLLQRRPDIGAAERRVAAANARIGSARAAQYPLLTLGLSGGFEASSGQILDVSNGFWALGPAALLLPLFDGGRRAADVRAARATFAEQVADYRATVLAAFREVEDNLALAKQLAEAAREQADAAAAAARTRDLALIRYRAGASDYLEVVTAQTDALEARRDEVDLQVRRLQAAVGIVRATGGSVALTGNTEVF